MMYQHQLQHKYFLCRCHGKLQGLRRKHLQKFQEQHQTQECCLLHLDSSKRYQDLVTAHQDQLKRLHRYQFFVTSVSSTCYQHQARPRPSERMWIHLRHSKEGHAKITTSKDVVGVITNANFCTKILTCSSTILAEQEPEQEGRASKNSTVLPRLRIFIYLFSLFLFS